MTFRIMCRFERHSLTCTWIWETNLFDLSDIRYCWRRVRCSNLMTVRNHISIFLWCPWSTCTFGSLFMSYSTMTFKSSSFCWLWPWTHGGYNGEHNVTYQYLIFISTFHQVQPMILWSPHLTLLLVDVFLQWHQKNQFFAILFLG